MKKYIKYLWLLIASLTISSCEDYFKTPLTQDIDVYDIFADEVSAETFLNGVYPALPYLHTHDNSDVTYKRCSYNKFYFAASASDEGAAGTNTSSWTNYCTQNTLTPANWNSDFDGPDNYTTKWLEDLMTCRYVYIRKCLIYLQYVTSIPNVSETFVKETSAQAKMAMAIFYFEMMYRYGSMPIVTEVVTGSEDVMDVIGTRPALSEYVEYVDGLLQEAIADLPATYSASDLGRLPKAAAYFLRARLWFWAASPLFNKETSDHWTQAVDHDKEDVKALVNYDPSGYDATLWDKAKLYTEEALAYCASNGYSMVDDASRTVKENYEIATYGIPEEDGGYNTECVFFTRRYAQSNVLFEQYNLPFGAVVTSSTTGSRNKTQSGGISVTQNFVNMYRDEDGNILYSPDEITEEQRIEYAKSTNPWSKLEPRFQASVLYKGQTVDGLTGTYTYTGEGMTEWTSLVTWLYGYNHRKFMPDEVFHVNAATDYTYDIIYVYMRLAELYLNYAEILWHKGDISGAMDQLKVTMNRGGLPTSTMSFPSDSDTAFEWIVRERAVELAIEGFRYFDCKRWLRGDWIAKQKYGVMSKDYYENTQSYDYMSDYVSQYPSLAAVADNSDNGFIILNGHDYLQYTNNTFNPDQYLWPIIELEMLKDKGWIQNPGY